MVSLFTSALYAPLEHLINRLLSQDPVACARLAPHKGKSIAIECTTLSTEIILLIESQSVQLRSVYEGEITSTIRGSSSALLGLLSRSDKSGALFGEGISIDGDMQLVEEIYECLSQLQIDWENPLGDIIGDAATHQIANLFNRSTQWAKQSSTTMRDNIDEYLHEEARVFPTNEEVQDFYDSNHELKLTVDRLTARLQRLSTSIEKLEKGQQTAK